MRDVAMNMETEAGRAADWLDRDWLAVFASILGQLLSVGTLTIYSFGVFIHPLHAEFGWSRTQLAVAMSISQYAVGAASPFWGVMTDRFGPRVILLPATVMLSLLVGSLGLLTPHLWHLYLMFFLIPVLGPSPVLYMAVLARLFDRHLGLALGLGVMGVGLGAAILPSVAQALVGAFGWRDAYVGLGVISLLIGLPVALVATRHVRGPVLGRAERRIPSVLPSVRTRTFALMCTVFVLLGLVSVGTLVHLVPMMIDRGFAPATAARLAGLTGLAALLSRGGIGWVLDQMQTPRLIGMVALVAVVVFLLLGFGSGRATDYVAAILLGGVLGAEVDFIGFLTRRYFPQAVFGRLFGLLFLVFTLGGGTGPVMMGLSFDRLGGYRPALLLFAVIGAVVAATAMALPKYNNTRPL